MKQGTKQRIVGSVVLLSLALIFLPIIFDGQGSYQPTVSSRIPEAPVLTALPPAEPTRPEIIADTDAIRVLPETTEATTVSPESAENETPDAAGDSTDSVESPIDASAAGEDIAVLESEPDYRRELPQLDATGLPEGWSVRLGAFSDGSNASNLLQRLQDAGYRAYTRQRSSNQGELSVVYVGPWLDRGQAEDYLAQLQEEFRLNGMIERYQVEQL